MFIFATSAIQNNTISKEGKDIVANSLNGTIHPTQSKNSMPFCPNYKHKT